MQMAEIGLQWLEEDGAVQKCLLEQPHPAINLPKAPVTIYILHLGLSQK
jgi:hypothetical protein